MAAASDSPRRRSSTSPQEAAEGCGWEASPRRQRRGRRGGTRTSANLEAAASDRRRRRSSSLPREAAAGGCGGDGSPLPRRQSGGRPGRTGRGARGDLGRWNGNAWSWGGVKNGYVIRTLPSNSVWVMIYEYGARILEESGILY